MFIQKYFYDRCKLRCVILKEAFVGQQLLKKNYMSEPFGNKCVRKPVIFAGDTWVIIFNRSF
jgi:hypothetical protein